MVIDQSAEVNGAQRQPDANALSDRFCSLGVFYRRLIVDDASLQHLGSDLAK
jgi:hypothetical protein